MSGGFDSARPRPGAIISRIGAAAGIAAEGVALSLGAALAGIVLALAGVHLIAAIVILAAVAIAMFFRDPERFPARTEGVVISGADGKVTDISEADLPGAPGAPDGAKFTRVSVFMSPLNVHVNRAPVGGEVIRVEHTAGEFRAAFRDDASERNERNLMVFSDSAGRRFGMLQVAGYLARRIVCRLRIHDRIEPGQRIGLIMFGSRVDHFFAPEFKLAVAIGDRVRAGESILAEISAEKIQP
ncbi:MAG TPA: phosphatidylserine decarboxylase [Candidatus Binataceae bacterium]|nr:phosphatidylserine decarboxylase [Candidatus Binataceae bacterium]